jgi:di/tricarboxylate transporter
VDWQAWLSLCLTAGSLTLLAATRISPHLVMMGVLTVLSIAGVISPAQALGGFANPGLVTVAAMFVVAAGLHASGGIDLIVHRMLGRPKSERRAILRILLPVLPLSAFLNNTPVVATLIPAINAWSRRINVSPSRLMMPLSYGAILGGTMTLIGTSTNLVVNGQYQALTGEPGFGLFSIAAVGVPVAVVGVLAMLVLIPWLLPDRSEKRPFENMREFTLEVAVAPDGPLVGLSIEAAGLRNLRRVYLVEIDRRGHILTAVEPNEVLQGGDRLVFAGQTTAISDLLRIRGIVPSEHTDTPTLSEPRSERRLVEVVVSASCAAIGETVRESGFRDRYGAVILAVARNGERVAGNLGSIRITPGDTLLLETRPSFIGRQRYSKDFLLVSDTEQIQPQHDRAMLAWIILAAAILSASTGMLSMLNAALAAAALMLLSGCVTAGQAEKSLDIPVLVTIGASFALGTALEVTGVADWVAASIVALADGRAWMLLVLTYLTVSLLTEVVTNNAAAIIMVPIVVSMTATAGLNAEPFIFAIMMAASASFATPLGYQTNMMVMGPGNYRFADFLRVGLPMNLVIAAATLGVLIIGWPLYATS